MMYPTQANISTCNCIVFCIVKLLCLGVLSVQDYITHTHTAMWEEVSPGGGLNQYNPFLPHARSLHAGAPVSSTSFAIFGGCAR